MKIEIKHRWTDEILFTYEGESATVAIALQQGIKAEADLRFANLTEANLTGANLTKANLTEANLTEANLRLIKADFQFAIEILPDEIPFLRTALIEGRIDGTSHTGECACLAGTFAHAKKCNHNELKGRFNFEVSASSPRERWFLGIRPGDTPENNQVAAITLTWIDETLAKINAA